MRVLPSLARETGTTAADRRLFPRADVRYPIRLEASLSTTTTRILRVDLPGVTVDLSRGGLLASVPESLAPGVRCRVHFLPDEHRLGQLSVPGRVRRLDRASDDSLVAVEFDEALDHLDVASEVEPSTRRWPFHVLGTLFSF